MSKSSTFVNVLGKVFLNETQFLELFSDNGGSFRCTVVDGDYDKLKQMSTNIKGMSRKLRKFSKTLNQITRAMDGA